MVESRSMTLLAAEAAETREMSGMRRDVRRMVGGARYSSGEGIEG